MELKYDFIDSDHERMHNALIAAGWTCENDAIPFNCKNIKWKWVYKKGKESIYFDSMHFDILHRNINDKRLKFHYTLFSEVADIIEAELKAIRDTNPDEEIKTQEKQEYYPINKDNIVEVLEYNGVNIDIHIGTSISETSRIYIRHESISRDIFSCDLDRNWLSCLESFLNIKLKPIPIPKPKFDFVQYLLNSNYFNLEVADTVLYNKNKTLQIVMNHKNKDQKRFFIGDAEIKPTEHNAKIFVGMAKLSEGLK